MSDKDIAATRKDAEGKNKEKIYCTFCPSKMLNSGAASLVNVDVSTRGIIQFLICLFLISFT